MASLLHLCLLIGDEASGYKFPFARSASRQQRRGAHHPLGTPAGTTLAGAVNDAVGDVELRVC